MVSPNSQLIASMLAELVVWCGISIVDICEDRRSFVLAIDRQTAKFILLPTYPAILFWRDVFSLLIALYLQECKSHLPLLVIGKSLLLM